MVMATVLKVNRLRFVQKPAAIFFKISFAELQTSPKPYYCQQPARHAHSRRNVSYSAGAIEVAERRTSIEISSMPKTVSSLSILPLPNLIRSYLITAISSSPVLLRASLGALKLLSHSRSPLFNPDANPVLHFLLKRTLYAQFCAGETAREVDQTINRLKGMGYKGVMLGYAREVCLGDNEARKLSVHHVDETLNANEISSWAKGTLATVNMAQAGDFVSLKFTGAGRQALQHLTEQKPPSYRIEKAIAQVCDLAKARRVRLLFDAEQDAVQAGIERWTIDFMKRYNREGRALVYGTYQAYKKSTPRIMATHLELAHEKGFVLGVKLVRGAYLGCDPRHLFWDTIEETHKTYDGIAEALMCLVFNETLKPISPGAIFPSVGLILAGHNSDSFVKAQKIRDAQVSSGEPRVDLAYGQLMGMAENISCGLVHTGQLAEKNGRNSAVDIPRAYQYLVWGTVGECSQYLVRRAEENKDALSRTKESRKALGRELLRRLGMSARQDEVR